jgi:hypothetical protein
MGAQNSILRSPIFVPEEQLLIDHAGHVAGEQAPPSYPPGQFALDFCPYGMMKCGKAQCACDSDATKRHGPYFELTCKANAKTVNVKLSPEAAPL